MQFSKNRDLGLRCAEHLVQICMRASDYEEYRIGGTPGGAAKSERREPNGGRTRTRTWDLVLIRDAL